MPHYKINNREELKNQYLVIELSKTPDKINHQLISFKI